MTEIVIFLEEEREVLEQRCPCGPAGGAAAPVERGGQGKGGPLRDVFPGEVRVLRETLLVP